MQWRPASGNDAAGIVKVVFGSGDATDQAHGFVSSWQTEVAIDQSAVTMVIAVLPPSHDHHRGYGVLWNRRADKADNLAECITRLIAVAAAVPNLRVLQVTQTGRRCDSR